MIIDKLKKSCRQLGLSIKEMGELLDVEYEYIQMFISPDKKRNSFAIVAIVIDAQGNLDEHQFDIGLDVVRDFHKDYRGNWNDGSPLFASPEYRVAPKAELDPAWLKDKLEDFWDAYTFLQTNLFMLGDDSFFPDIQ